MPAGCWHTGLDLLARFNRLGLPARLGPLSLDEARAEVEALRDAGKA